MISKSKIKLIHSLKIKKIREQNNLFVAEGPKVVGELLKTFECNYIAATANWLNSNQKHISPTAQTDEVSTQELEKASLLDTPQDVLALFRIKQRLLPSPLLPAKQLYLALDRIQDPGNLGTIIRIANWFGIHNIICSNSTVDMYSPKVVQATMGALSGISISYTDIPDFLRQLDDSIPVYGTFLDGHSIYESTLSSNGIIVMGNEGNGISPEVEALVKQRLFIPPYPANASVIESLNVSVATAITCAEFRRRQ